MEKEIQIEKELENKRKLSKEVKDYINKKVFTNLAFSILYMMLMIAINILYLNIDLSEFIKKEDVLYSQEKEPVMKNLVKKLGGRV